MKKILNIVIAVMCVLGMMTGFIAGEDPVYEEGLLTMTMYEEGNNAHVIKISDGEIVNNSSPSLVLVIKLRDSPINGSDLKVIEISAKYVGSQDLPESLPDEIDIHIVGDSDEASLIDMSMVVINEDIRGEQLIPEFIPPYITIYDDIRGEQFIPEIIHSDQINV